MTTIGPIEEHEFESHRAVVGDDEIGHEHIRRDVGALRDMNPGISRATVEAAAPVDPAHVSRRGRTIGRGA